MKWHKAIRNYVKIIDNPIDFFQYSKFSVKIFKLLVGDLSDHMENALASAQDDHNDIDSGAEETDEVFICLFVYLNSQ